MAEHHLATCTDNHGHEVSLELRKLYGVLPDRGAEKHGQLRVLDLPRQVIDRILHAA